MDAWPSMDAWSRLAAELDLWQQAGRVATLWWRDDDAISDTPALRRLLEVAQVPLALAVIPARLQPSLITCLDKLPATQHVAVLQHGFSHDNHEPPERKKAELGAARSVEKVLAELGQGADRLRTAFGARSLPVLTPPWNRIAPAVIAGLPGLGFQGLTTYLPRPQAMPIPGLVQVNTHVDIIDWHQGRGFLGEEPSLALLISHLQARRLGTADAAEPTGLLTHHLAHDEACWGFLTRLQHWLSAYPVIRWVRGEAAFTTVVQRTDQ